MKKRNDESKNIIIYAEDLEEQIQDFSDAELGTIFRALLAYANRGEDFKTDDRAVNCLYRSIRGGIERSHNAYMQKCEKNKRIAEERERKKKETQTCTNVHERARTYTNVHLPNLTEPNLTEPNLTEPNLTEPNLTELSSLTINGEVEEMKCQPVWKEQVMMRFKVTEQMVNEALDDFKVDCLARGTHGHDNLGDAKRHFNDWLRIQIQKSDGNKKINGVISSPEANRCAAEAKELERIRELLAKTDAGNGSL